MKRRDSPSAQESPMNRTEVDITFITTTTSCFPSISNILFCDIITDKRIIKSCNSWLQLQIEQHSEPVKKKCPEFLCLVVLILTLIALKFRGAELKKYACGTEYKEVWQENIFS